MSGNGEPGQEVHVTDIRMPFGSMVVFMVKWAVAAIPALLILLIIGAIFWTAALALTAGAFFGASSVKPAVHSSVPSPSSGDSPHSEGAKVEMPAGGAADSHDAKATAESEYLGSVLVRNVSVGKSILDEPGVFGEIKNAGDRTLKKVEITIYCLGPDSRPVFEKSYTPVIVLEHPFGRDEGPLKAGYSRKFGVKLDDAPSDWTKKVEVKVTEVQFE